MQQIYQQQMQAQVNTTISNEEKKSSGIEMPDIAALTLGNGSGDADAEVQTEAENQTEPEKLDFGVSAENDDEAAAGEEHQCSEECGFCSDDESTLFILNTQLVQSGKVLLLL